MAWATERAATRSSLILDSCDYALAKSLPQLSRTAAVEDQGLACGDPHQRDHSSKRHRSLRLGFSRTAHTRRRVVQAVQVEMLKYDYPSYIKVLKYNAPFYRYINMNIYIYMYIYVNLY